MCRCDDAPKSRMKSSIGDAVSNAGNDHETPSVVPPSESHSQSLSKDCEENGEGNMAEMRSTVAHAASSSSRSSSSSPSPSKAKPATIESILPNVVWLEHVLPFLDRPSWNATMEASREIYKLTVISKLTAEYQSLGPAVAQPPWPTNLAFQSKSGGQGLAIESMTLSSDGEFLACGSVIGSIEIWNLRTGKLRWKATHPLGSDEAEARAQCPDYYAPTSSSGFSGGRRRNTTTEFMERRSTPIGSVVKFAPEGYTLACGFENRIFVWDLESTLFRRGFRKTMLRNGKRICQLSGRKSSYVFPPQPQIRDDSTEEQPFSDGPRHPHLPRASQQNTLPGATSVGHWLYERQQRAQQDKEQQEEYQYLQNQEMEEEESFQVLDIECRKGTIYDVTYLGFSQASGKSLAGHRLIARYGKMAYIWTKKSSVATGEITGGGGSSSSNSYVLSHRIALTSSRCQMVSNPSLTCLAVATNGGGAAASRRRREAEEGSSSDTSSTSGNAQSLDGKGVIHVWDVPEQEQQKVTIVDSKAGSKIVAYRHHVVRGLEYLEIGGNTSCLVSASLQGEVKFWKPHRPNLEHPRDRYNHHSNTDSHNNDSSEEKEPYKGSFHGDDETLTYVCVYQFQSPGKIFSLASWSTFANPASQNEHDGRIFLAAGEARGQVRVWKVSPESLAPSSSVSACCSPSATSATLEPFGRTGRLNQSGAYSGKNNNNKLQRLEECLSTEVGDHVHYDNIKLLAFTPNGKSLAVSRAYDSKIWFQTVWQ